MVSSAGAVCHVGVRGLWGRLDGRVGCLEGSLLVVAVGWRGACLVWQRRLFVGLCGGGRKSV